MGFIWGNKTGSYETGNEKVTKLSLITSSAKQTQNRVQSLLKDTILLAASMADHECMEILKKRLKTLSEPAMFVVVGEVKAGKSSFINAFLHEDICAVDAAPCTSTVQEIVYGEDYAKVEIDNSLERISIPAKTLKNIIVVDTPGTNSIIEKHQIITERYIPQSDAVIFVFSSKNPYTATAWQLFSIVRKQWRRKIVFVLQQKDTATEKELLSSRDFITKKAVEHGIASPAIFELSVFDEKNEAFEKSGFEEFRKFMREQIEKGDVRRIKLESSCKTILEICEQFLSSITKQEDELEKSLVFIQNTKSEISRFRKKADRIKQIIIERLEAVHKELSYNLVETLRDGLSVDKVMRRSIPLLRDKKIEEWFGQVMVAFEKTLSERFRKTADSCTNDFINDLSGFNERIMRQLMEKKMDGTVGASQTGRSEVSGCVTDVRENWDLDKFAAVAFKGYEKFPSRVAGGCTTITAGGLLAALTNISLLDYTGISIGLAGTAYVSYYALWKSRRIIRDISKRCELEREKFKKRLDSELSYFLDLNFSRMESPIEDICLKKEEELAGINKRKAEIIDIASRADDELKR